MTDSTIDLKALRNVLRDPKHKGFKGKQFNRYDLISEIARGGMGVVFRAKHRELGSLVALKLLAQADPSKEAVGRFKREARVLAKLKHTNVVDVSDLGEENGVAFLAMELIEGHSLQDELEQHRDSQSFHTFQRAVEITLAIARALAYCHEAGAIHRDVKPHNILIEAATGRPVLTDFGLVKRDPAKMGQSANISGAVSHGKILGTPSFMSPEQFEPKGEFGKVGPKSDVWGLGAVLYTLLTAVPPFKARNVVELYGLVMEEEPTPPSMVRDTVPEVLDELCLACLTKKVDQRVGMQDLVQRLETLSANPKQLEAAKGSHAGLRHVMIIIAIMALLAGVHVAFIDPDQGKRLWHSIVGAPPEAEKPKEEDTAAKGPSPAKILEKAKGGDVSAIEKVLLGQDGVKADPEQAIELYEKAAEANSPAALMWLGNAHMKSRYSDHGLKADFGKAIQYYERAAAIEGKHVVAAKMRLGGLLRQREPKRALDYYREVVATDGVDESVASRAKQEITKLQNANPDLEK